MLETLKHHQSGRHDDPTTKIAHMEHPMRSLPGGVGVPERLERALRHHSRRGLPAGGRGQDPGRQQLGPQVWLGPAFAPVRLTVMTGVPVDAMCA